MTISSRTPEGEPHCCRICGEVAALEVSEPSGDCVCPACGSLLWRIRDRIGGEALARFVDEPELDSLDMVELVMELEDEFDLQIPEEDQENFQSPADLICYLRKRLGIDPPD